MVVDLSPWAVKCIDKKRRAFLWKSSDEVKGGHCMLGWPKVCRPPELGGLGFLDLQLFGYALRMRWLWLKRTDDSRPWSQLPDRGGGMLYRPCSKPPSLLISVMGLVPSFGRIAGFKANRSGTLPLVFLMQLVHGPSELEPLHRGYRVIGG